ncbi:membrane bound O-acyl transferase MBOAT family protein [Candidatus Moduliflexus flocculans]|uniref:Membrane bound O-acyl transferase MBOAT family protein n=1 Tax=Candidatus Moduliflexus flocculans TaxID=1499966 RepID=A0A0S6VYE0_9BACT|nr:membrane bound O-acyl transferase MBOAT family protein [Candidatus Moduliflexus flocculans]
MSFVSYEFLILLGCVFGSYFLLPHRWQNYMLLVASYVFYGWWDYRFLSLMLISSVLDYFCSFYADPHLQPARSERQRKIALLISVTGNLGLLGFFKYFNFFTDSMVEMLQWFGIAAEPMTLRIILPVGISFYTFQTMSYTLDVYRGQLRATRHFLDFCLFVSFFPQLVAGPIERASHLLPQMLAPRVVTWENFSSGMQLAFWGFFKKMVIADNLSVIANATFNQSTYTGSEVIIAVYAFAFQIYCDFSGYTDIARGVARMLGFDICVNFRLPYFATNPSDFWQRWHVSLSSWLRDYLYIPLGGNRRGVARTYINLSLTMLLGGLWHGASWHFVVWGAYHGLLLVIFRLLSKSPDVSHVNKPPRTDWLFWLKAFGFFQITCFGWLIFRANDMRQLAAMIAALFTSATLSGLFTATALQVLIFAAPLLLLQVYQYATGDMEPWRHWPEPVKVPYYVAVSYAIMLLGSPVKEAFIYFQF